VHLANLFAVIILRLALNNVMTETFYLTMVAHLLVCSKVVGVVHLVLVQPCVEMVSWLGKNSATMVIQCLAMVVRVPAKRKRVTGAKILESFVFLFVEMDSNLAKRSATTRM